MNHLVVAQVDTDMSYAATATHREEQEVASFQIALTDRSPTGVLAITLGAQAANVHT